MCECWCFNIFITTYPVTELHCVLCDYNFVRTLPDSTHILLIYSYTCNIGCFTIKTNSTRTHLHLFCDPIIHSHCLIRWSNSGFLINLEFNLFFTIFPVYEWPHIRTEIFSWGKLYVKRFAVPQTLLNKDVIVDYISPNRHGVSWHMMCCVSALPYHVTLMDPQSCHNT